MQTIKDFFFLQWKRLFVFFGLSVVTIYGFSTATAYKSSLTTSITSSASTIAVASIADKGGTSLTMANLGNRVFFDLEPGTSREEIIYCTGLSGTSWTGCVRGLSFQGSSLTASSTLAKAHNAGSSFVMSNVHYVYEELVDKQATSAYEEYLGGTYVYSSSSPIFFGSNGSGLNCLPSFRDGSTTSTLPRLCFDNTNNYWVAYDDGLNSYRLASSTNITGGRGLKLTGSVLDVATTTSRFSGLRFWNEGGDFNLAVATSSASGGAAMGVDTNGLFLRVDTSAGLAFDSIGRLVSNPNWTNIYLSGYITATSTAGTSTFRNVLLGDPAGNVIMPAWAASSVVSTATSTLTGNLQINGSINATGINYITPRVAVGSFSRNFATADAPVVYTHGLSVKPEMIKIDCFGDLNAGGDYAWSSSGVSNGSASQAVSAGLKEPDAGQVYSFSDSTNIIYVVRASAGGAGEVGTISAINDTSFTITYAESVAQAMTMQCSFVAFR